MSREPRPARGSKPPRAGAAGARRDEATAGGRRRDTAGRRPRDTAGPTGSSPGDPPRAESAPHPVTRSGGPTASATGPLGGKRRLHLAALAAVLAVALGLRLWNLGHGLPDFLDEALPFRWALGMWSDPGAPIDWNPHRFHHPTLATYLHLFVQQAGYFFGRLLGSYQSAADYHVSFLTDPTSMALAARSVGVVADVVTVLLVARIGERLRPGAGWFAALMVACSPTLIVAARSICSDSVMAALAIAAVERMLAWRERGGRGRLVAAAVLTGLAAGAKYPAALLLLPLAAAMWQRDGVRALGLWPLAAAIAGAVFLATTPFAVLDFATFRRDLGFVQGLAQKGHFGNLAESGFLFHMRNLVRDFSWVGVVLLPVSLAWTASRAWSRPDALLLWLALLAFGLPIALARVEAERYLLPVLPLAAVLIAEVAFALAERLPVRARAAGVVAAAALLAAPALVAGARAVASSGGETRIEARRWCEAHLTSRDLVVQENYGAPLLQRLEWLTVRSGPAYQSASPAVRTRYDSRRWFACTTLPLAVVGSSSNRVRPPSGPPKDIEVFPHVADFNQAAYDPRLLQGVDYFVTSSAVRGRFEADLERYAAENRFYALLDSAAEVAARFRPRGTGGTGGTGGGPEIVFYRLGARAQRALAAFGPLDTLWWAEIVPRAYRERAEDALRPARPSGGAVRTADGSPAAWVTSLRPVYEYQFSYFVLATGMELADRGDFAAARRLAAATLVMAPDDPQACVLYVTCSASLGEWSAARTAIERTLGALEAGGQASPTLRLHYGEILANLGDRDGARREFEAMTAVGGEIGAEARRRLERLR